MKNAGLIMASAALVSLGVGCKSNDQELAQTPYGDTEKVWSRQIKESYPEWKAPATPPPNSCDSCPASKAPCAQVSVALEAEPAPVKDAVEPASPKTASVETAQAPVKESAVLPEKVAVTEKETAEPVAVKPATAVVAEAPEQSAVSVPEEKPFFKEPENFVVKNNFGSYQVAPLDPSFFGIKKPEPVAEAVTLAKKPEFETYVVKKGDNLSKIAKKYYGAEHKWTEIYDANKGKIQRPDLIKPGTELKIPLH